MAAVTQFALDPASRRIDDGRVLLGGSPMALFRLTPAGWRLVDAIEHGDPLPHGHERLTDRLLDAGAIHPLPDRDGGPPASDATVVIPALDGPADELARLVAQLGATPPASVVVIDDGSAVPIGPVAGARVLRLAVNRGPGAARNAALT